MLALTDYHAHDDILYIMHGRLLHSPFCQLLMLELCLLLPWAFRGCPHAMRPFCASHYAGGFSKLISHMQLQRSGHEPVFFVPEWQSICLCLPGLFDPAFTLILRAFYSAVIGIKTYSSYDRPTCFVPELVAGSASVSLT